MYENNGLIAEFKSFAEDESDEIRLLALGSLTKIANILSFDENKQHTLPIIIASS